MQPRHSCLLAVVALSALSVFLGCKAEFESGVTRCSPNGQCPSGYVCQSGVCFSQGELSGGAGGSGGKGGQPGTDVPSAGTGGDGGSAGAGAGGSSGGAGGGQGGAGGGGPAPPADCAQYAAAWCAKKAECEPISNFFTSDADCRTGMELYCRVLLAEQPDSTWTAATAGVCVREMQTAGCFEWYGLGASRKCDPRGTRTGGEGTFSWVSCESAASYWRGGACGYCYPPAAAGQPCRDDAVCPPGHLCSTAGRCRPVSVNGQPCGDDGPCHPALRCAAGVCTPRAVAGVACTRDLDCDSSAGLLCNRATGRCGRAVLGMAWNSGNPDGTVSSCAGGTTRLSNGSCAPLAMEGQPCAASGPFCRVPMVCTAGKCAPPKVVDCPKVRPAEGYPAGQDPWCSYDVQRPKYCPARGELGWYCWPADTACETVTVCSGNQLKYCADAKQAFDCEKNACIANPCLATPATPVYCPPRGDAAFGCGSPTARCSTLTNCNGRPMVCSSDQQSPDCALNRCVPTCALPAGAGACDTCTAQKCCGSFAACQGDPMCRSKAGPNWMAYQSCATTFCAQACPAATLAPPPPR